MRTRAILGALVLLSCSAPTEGTGASESGTETEGSSESDATGTADGCAAVDCGGQGECLLQDGNPVCLCNDGTFDDTPPLDCGGAGTASGSGGSGSSSTSGGGSGSASAGSGSSGSSGTGSTTDPTTGGTSTGGSTGGSSGGGSTSGGGLPDGDPCTANEQCISGYCYESDVIVGEPKCQPDCIGPLDFTSTCDDDVDCCEGTCEQGITGWSCQS